MGKIKIEDIKNEAAQHNWTLLSDEYINLNEPLRFLCPVEHEVFVPYKKVRNKWVCQYCEDNPYNIKSVKPVEKSKGAKRILALDAATGLTGWAVFDDNDIVNFGHFKSNNDKSAQKINSVKYFLMSMIDSWKPDVVFIEDIQLQQINKVDSDNVKGVTTYKVLANLQGVLIDTCLEKKVDCILVHSATWRHYCEIKGRTRTDKKKNAQIKVKKWYNVIVTEDEADAICLGKYGASYMSNLNNMIEF